MQHPRFTRTCALASHRACTTSSLSSCSICDTSLQLVGVSAHEAFGAHQTNVACLLFLGLLEKNYSQVSLMVDTSTDICWRACATPGAREMLRVMWGPCCKKPSFGVGQAGETQAIEANMVGG